MPPPKARVLVNPSSGAGRGAQVSEEIQESFRAWGAEIVTTEHEGQATELAREAAGQGIPMVVAVGGDDTVREVIKGILRSSTALGIMPMGTFNNIAVSLGIPLDPRAAADVVQNGRNRTMDLGELQDGTFFTETVGVGFDPEAFQALPEQEGKGLGRWFNAARAGIQTLRTFRPKALAVRLDGTSHVQRAIMVTIANTPYTAARMQLAPHARPDDGVLDVAIIPSIGMVKFFFSVPFMFTGQYVKFIPEIEYIQGKEIVITGRKPLPVRVDNTVSHTLPITVRVLPGILPVRVPLEGQEAPFPGQAPASPG